jgi:hypothetical protein
MIPIAGSDPRSFGITKWGWLGMFGGMSNTTGESRKPLRGRILALLLPSHFKRALRYPSQRLLVLRFGLGLLLAIALLTALGYVIGGEPVKGGDLVYRLTKAMQSPAVAAALALMAVTLGAWCLRRLWLEYLAWLPGTIHVADFSNPSEIRGVLPGRLTTQFRNRLTTLRLQSAAASPGALPASTFLEVLREDPSSDSVGKFVSFLRATFPSTALVISGTLITRPRYISRACCGVSLTVSRLPNQGSMLEEIWDTSWERVMRRAADGATAAILPRTRLCRGPWVTWRGYVMPPELLAAYEDACELSSQRRYYEALESCDRALKHDPLNRAVRLQQGKIQEQLRQYLAALESYEGMLTAARPAGHKLPRRLYSRRARRERTRLKHIARYRLIVLLGARSAVRDLKALRKSGGGGRLEDIEEALHNICAAPREVERRRAAEVARLGARQRTWVTCIRASHPLLTRGQRARCRKAIEHARRQHKGELRKLIRTQHTLIDASLLDSFTLNPEHRSAGLRLSEIEDPTLPFARCARMLADDLCRDLRRWRRTDLRREPHLLGTTVAVTRACVEERLRLLEGDRGRTPLPSGAQGDSAWAETVDRMERRLAKCGLRSYQSHYNAACLFALPLLPEAAYTRKLGKRRASMFAQRAVDQLAVAASHADSAFLATRRDWLIGEDPDLAGLRTRPEFTRFVDRYFPTVAPTEVSPADADELVAAEFARETLLGLATEWVKVWRRRSNELLRGRRGGDLRQWWPDEGEAWRLVADIGDMGPSWETRVALAHEAHVRLVQEQRGWRERHGAEFDPPPFRRYEEVVHRQRARANGAGPQVEKEQQAADQGVRGPAALWHRVADALAAEETPSENDLLGDFRNAADRVRKHESAASARSPASP